MGPLNRRSKRPTHDPAAHRGSVIYAFIVSGLAHAAVLTGLMLAGRFHDHSSPPRAGARTGQASTIPDDTVLTVEPLPPPPTSPQPDDTPDDPAPQQEPPQLPPTAQPSPSEPPREPPTSGSAHVKQITQAVADAAREVYEQLTLATQERVTAPRPRKQSDAEPPRETASPPRHRPAEPAETSADNQTAPPPTAPQPSTPAPVPPEPMAVTTPTPDAATPQPSGATSAVPTGPIVPEYPRAAIRRGQEGLVIVAADVRADGTVAAARVQKSSGHARLDRAARQAVLQARFTPARRNGRPVPASVTVPVRFALR